MPCKDLEARRVYCREYHKKWIKKNPDKRRAYEKAVRLKNPSGQIAKARRQALRRKYGIELAVYDQMFLEQGGVCAICGEPELKKPLSVDHDHATGAVRGLVCNSCNWKLGVVESPMASALYEYLDRYRLTN